MTMNKNNYATTNKEWWEKMAKEDCGFTKPWLDLDVKILQKLANGDLKNPPEPLNDIYPISIFSDVKRKDVLCLASGGGQQSAVFALPRRQRPRLAVRLYFQLHCHQCQCCLLFLFRPRQLSCNHKLLLCLPCFQRRNSH